MNDEKKRDGYIIEGRIAEGAFGTVFKAIRTSDQKVVAIKDLFFSSNKKSKQVVEREVTILKQLDAHQNVIQLIDATFSNTKCSLVMEYAKYDLKHYLESTSPPLSHAKIKRFAYQLLEGLNHIHFHNIIHRDLKPSNILLDDQSQLKIGDFGSAITEDQRKDNCFSIEGFTRWYKSPEQLFGARNYTTSIDIWSFACIYAELLQGYPLFHGNNEIEQIGLIADVLGNPCVENWPSIGDTPDYGKILFKPKPRRTIKEIIPYANESEIKFLESALRYDQRPSAKELLDSDYFKDQSIPLTLKKKHLELPPRTDDPPYFNYCSLIKKSILQ